MHQLLWRLWGATSGHAALWAAGINVADKRRHPRLRGSTDVALLIFDTAERHALGAADYVLAE